MVQSAGVQTMSRDSAFHSGAVFSKFNGKAFLLSNYEQVGKRNGSWIDTKELSSNPEHSGKKVSSLRVRSFNLYALKSFDFSHSPRQWPHHALTGAFTCGKETKKELLYFQGGVKHPCYTVAHESHEMSNLSA